MGRDELVGLAFKELPCSAVPFLGSWELSREKRSDEKLLGSVWGAGAAQCGDTSGLGAYLGVSLSVVLLQGCVLRLFLLCLEGAGHPAAHPGPGPVPARGCGVPGAAHPGAHRAPQGGAGPRGQAPL